jgi:hypothetical protein
MSRKWLVAILATVALTGACSKDDGGGDGVASLNGDQKTSGQNNQQASGTDQDKMREFTKCMREHGVDMPEPDAEGRIAMRASGQGEADKNNAAQEACKNLMPNGGKPPKLSPEDLDKARAQAKCMREHGIDMPDPNPDEPGMTISLGDGADKDKMEKAFKECGMGDAMPAVSGVGGGK